MVLELFGEKWAKNLALLIEKVSSKLTELTELTEQQKNPSGWFSETPGGEKRGVPPEKLWDLDEYEFSML